MNLCPECGSAHVRRVGQKETMIEKHDNLTGAKRWKFTTQKAIGYRCNKCGWSQ